MKQKKLRYDLLKPISKRLRQALFRFCVYGALLVAGEVGFYTLTKTGRLVPLLRFLFQYDWEVDARLALHHIWDVPVTTLFGQASLYMFLVYGAICVAGLEPAYRAMKKKDFPLILRGLVYMAIILFMECSLGWILRFATGYDIWYYRGPGTLFRYTSLAIAPIWFICGLVSENVIGVIDALDDLKMNVYGLSDWQEEGPGARRRDRIVVLSDVHIGPKNGDGSPAGWFYGPYEIYLTIILFKIAMDRRVKELVFLGDLFDTWLCAPGEKPESARDIIAKWSGSLFMAPLRTCVAACPAVYYIPGNHDMHVKEEDLELLAAAGKRIRLVTADEYNALAHLDCGATLVMEHGNAGDFFNAPGDDRDTVQGLPLGYFVSRLSAGPGYFDLAGAFLTSWARVLASGLGEGRGERPAGGEAEKGGAEKGADRAGRLFVEFFVDALVAYANRFRDEASRIGDATVIRMPDGYRDVTVGEVKKSYSSLLSDWLAERKTFLFAAGGKNALDRYAREKFGKVDRRKWLGRLASCRAPELVVVMGHTHYGLVQRVLDREKQGIYANTGCLCRNRKQAGCRWVEITDSPRRCSVRLRKR